MSGLFGSTTIKGTRITDFSATAVSVGAPIAFGYGAFPVDGKVGFANLPPEEHRNVEKQGKGGVKQETFTYTLSYAIFFCFGEIDSFIWIKRNGKVVYTTDPDAPIEDQDYAAKWAERVNFHYGTPDQLPDSMIESIKGTGNVSAFKRWCYITLEDEDVTDGGGAVPSYEACVLRGGVRYITTVPYPVRSIEVGLRPEIDLSVFRSNPYSIPVEPALSSSVVLSGFTVSGGEESFTQPPEPALAPNGILLTDFTVTVAGGEVEHDQPSEPTIAMGTINLTDFSMSGGEVNYNPTEPALSPSISLTDFTME